MVKVTKIKSGSPYETRDSYSRVVMVDDWIFVSNTAGRNYQTREISDDPAEQTRQCFANIEAALAAAGASLADVVQSRVFVPDPADAAAVMEIVGEKFRGIDPQRTVTCPPLGSTIYKVEIEVTACRGVGAAEAEIRTITI